jgi:hypothetical protein
MAKWFVKNITNSQTFAFFPIRACHVLSTQVGHGSGPESLSLGGIGFCAVFGRVIAMV